MTSRNALLVLLLVAVPWAVWAERRGFFGLLGEATGGLRKAYFLPRFSIGKRSNGQIYEFEHQSPGVVTFPRRIAYHTKEPSIRDVPETDFDEARFVVEITDAHTGKKVFSQMIAPRGYRAHDHRTYDQVLFPASGHPAFQSDHYRIRVTVSDASRSYRDQAQLIFAAPR
ncbi:MAG: hypothetical protein AAGJ31_01535 [Verrucomicrobiota bacterium]